MIKLNNIRIAVIGLGYVGLPLSIAFSKYFETIGYDINQKRIKELQSNYDQNNENKNFLNKKLKFTHKKNNLEEANFYIVTVPTPIKKNKSPDLKSLIQSTHLVSKFLKKNNIVVFESTIYPGATEEVCKPIIEKISKMKINYEIFLGYSPERINPGDKKHTLYNTVKITSGSNLNSAKLIDQVYRKIVKKTVRVNSIKIAESAKIIENTQRDINIALINEFSILLKKMQIPINEVLDAANTKWNFLNFKPGLVGGHCIGVDPYYLSYKFKKMNLKSDLILSGRHINDNNHKLVSKDIYRHIKNQYNHKKIIRTLVLGFTFKEDCTDIRNSKVFDLIFSLNSKNPNFKFEIFDPNYMDKINFALSNTKQVKRLPKVKNKYDLIIIAVPHKKIKKIGLNQIKLLGKKDAIIYDYKLLFGPNTNTVNF